ncbi:MAG: 1-acyl-sn-glycerol-3-phosphate acyltransferase [Firmicutes bacterium ADurb.Bin373]|nr:1-acyl-sn-glycerol-3-phosphate acyltransferase [Bacillota bacterium]OQA09131.1 MAG: 1-acyl-sn-glycerol-3-phosphate acyltransferase [Firmicutes bacterium ADurb.Bin373]
MIYRLLKFMATVILTIVRRWDVQGRENLPAGGGFLLVANHVSYWDPVVVICAFKKKVCFMAKSELFNIPVIGYVLRISGSFPVRRDKSDREAIRTALRLLAEGQMVGVFPEGTRSHTGDLLRPHLGAAMLAAKAKVPMIPVALIGTRGVFGRVRMIIGAPVESKNSGKVSKTDLEKASDLVMDRILSMMKKH